MLEDVPFAFDSQTFSFASLWLPSITIFIFGYIVCTYILKDRLQAFVIAAVKALLFFSYFYFVYDGTYTSGSDDYYYLSKGALLVKQIREIPLASIELMHVAESFHFMYVVISAIAQYAFGEHYYSLAAINVMASILCGVISYAIIKNQYQDDKLAKIFCMAMLIYPDVLSWSSVFAGKDTFVLLGHLIFLYAFSNLIKGDVRRGGLFILIALLFMLNLRFYVVIIFLPLVFLKIQKRFVIYLFSLGLIAAALFFDLFHTFAVLFKGGMSYVEFDDYKFLRLPFDVVHFWLTPRPFHEDSIHGFLLFADIFNWIFFPLIFFGLLKCFRSKDQFAKFLAIYFLAFSVFYGLIDYLNGPRHRLQLTFALIFFLWVGANELKRILRNHHLSFEKDIQ